MVKKYFQVFIGLAGCLVPYATIVVSIYLSPWFSWNRNALSDLGHSVKSEVAPIYNCGLLLGGLLIVLYAVLVFNKHAKYSGLCIFFSGLFLQLVATFDEVYGRLHFIISVLFFVSIGISSLVYSLEERSVVGAVSFITCILSWLLFELEVYVTGIAVPEIISSLAVTTVVAASSINFYLEEQREQLIHPKRTT